MVARRGRWAGRGFTLLEVVISMLLSAVMISAIMSVALTSKTASGKADRKLVAGMATRQLSSQLKGYVTSYYNYTTNNWISGINEIGGPAAPGTPGAASWVMIGGTVKDDCGVCPGQQPTSCWASAPTCYALSTGLHTLIGYMPSWFESAPYTARISYNVTSGMKFVSGAGMAPSVTINVQWSEP